MAGLQFDNRLSAGNILVVLGMVVGGATAWGHLNGRADSMAAKLADHAASLSAHEARIRAMETTTARQDERMVLILDSLRKIEARLDTSAHPR
ncbi:hypothetical protein [Paracoccus simplex]|uniref:Uncharacterized protein n=1 Tax=Paracoccus simplex TaxID=2086346 RepID=A0ABV7RWE4_9RHOB